MAIIDFFDRGWSINRNGTAYVMDGQKWTYDQVYAQSCRISHGLCNSGLPKETVGAVLAGNHPDAWTCVLGLWRAGLSWLPLNPRSSEEETRHLLENFDAEVLFFQSYFAPLVAKLVAACPKLRLLVCIDGDMAGSENMAKWCGSLPATPPAVDYDMDDMVAIMPTGGTTGMPKGVMLSHRNVTISTASQMIAASYEAGAPIVNLAAAPMTHSAGYLSLSCSVRGGTVVVLSKPDPAALLDAIEVHGVTEMFLPPTVIYRLLEIPGIEKRNFSSLKYFMYGAAPMSLEKLKRAITVFGPVMHQGYGQTEAPGAISFLRPGEHFVDGKIAPDSRLSSCGLPSPLNKLAILNDQGQPMPVGESGEICIRGDLVMKGYYKQPDKTAETIVNGWLHTGDVGCLDEEGFLHITDRKKDMIITGGFNVYPNEVEQVLWEHPAVQDCAVIGVPDDKWGEAVKAVVELNPGAQVDAETLIALCKEKLGSVKAPKSIDFVEILPRSPVGKVLKKDIRAPYWSQEKRRI